MVIDESWIEPATNSTEDIEAAERASLFTVRPIKLKTQIYYSFYLYSTVGLPTL